MARAPGRLVLLALLAALAAGQETRRESAPAESRAASRGRMLFVTAGADRKPAAGAVVEFVAVSGWDIELAPKNRDYLTSPDPRGGHPVTRLEVDDAGTVRLPPFAEGALVRGWLGGLCGETWLNAGAWGRYELRLEPAFSALVVDRSGSPVSGVLVFLAEHGEEQHGLRFIGPRTGFRTGTDGLAWFPRPRPPARKASPTTWRIVPGVPVAPSEFAGAAIDLDVPAPDPVRIELPEMGRVEVRLVREGGGAFTAPALVSVKRERGDPVADSGERFDYDTVWTEALATGGAAVFPHVAAGVRLCIRVEPGDEALRSIVTTAEGPAKPGETRVVEVRCGGPSLVVDGRLLGATSRPVARQTIRASLPRRHASSREEAFIGPYEALARTRDDGRFRLRFDADPAPLAGSKMTVVSRSRGADVETEHELPHDTGAGRVDLGDLTPGTLGVVAEGVIVDDGGEPVTGAWVQVVPPPPPGVAASRPDYEAIAQAAVADVQARLDLRGLQARSGRGGAFTIRGNVKLPELALVVRKKGWFQDEPFVFEVGEKELRIMLRRAGAVECTLATPGLEDVRGQIGVAVVGDVVKTAEHEVPWQRGRVDAAFRDGRFELAGLKPGECTVEVRIWSRDEPLLRVPNVRIKAGETTRDPRLQGVDLGKELRLHRLTVKDESGDPVKGALVNVRDGTERRLKWSDELRTDDGGEAVVATVGTSPWLLVRHAGHRSEDVRDPGDAVAVVLRRGEPIPVSIEVELPEPVEPPHRVIATLAWKCRKPGDPECDERDWSQPRNRALESRRIDAAGKVVLKVPDPGVYELTIAIEREHPVYSPSEAVLERSLTIEETAVPAVTVTLDAAKIAEAKAKLERER